jgi:hypothetical protein
MNKIYIYTCDKNLFLLKTTIYMINKYYLPNPEIIILGFKDPELNYKNITFKKIGDKQDVNQWSKYLYNFFKDIEDEFILTLFEDMFPVDYVNIEGIKEIKNYLKNNTDCGFCTLNNQPSFGRDKNEEIIINRDDLFLFKRPKNCNSKINLQVNLWRKEYFLKYLSHTKNPWAFEVDLSQIAKTDGYSNLSTSNYKIKTKCVFPNQINTALSEKHWLGKISVIGIRLADINYLIEQKYLDNTKLIFGSNGYYKYYKDINDSFDIKTFFDKAPKNLNNHWMSVYAYLYNINNNN